MSAISDKYEKDVAAWISNQVKAVHAERPKVGSNYSDVRITHGGTTAWLEVKMEHNNRLVSSRVYYKNKKWRTDYTTNVAKEAVKELNDNEDAKKFIADLTEYLRGQKKLTKNIDLGNIGLSTTKAGMLEKNAVHRIDLDNFLKERNATKFIMVLNTYDVGTSVTKHYNSHKATPVYYLQTGDDFIRMGTGSIKNPLGFTGKIPILSGNGNFKVRVATATDFYEIVAEMKMLKMPTSLYSLKPGTKKRNPFLTYK